MFTGIGSAAAALCLSLLFIGCSGAAIDEPPEPATRAGSYTVQVTSRVSEYFIGEQYGFGLYVTDGNGNQVIPARNPTFTVTGGQYETVTTRFFDEFIFEEGAIYTVTGSVFTNELLTAELIVNPTIYVRVKSEKKSITGNNVIIGNKLVFTADGLSGSEPVNVTKAVVIKLDKRSNSLGGVTETSYLFLNQYYPNIQDIIDGEYPLPDTDGYYDNPLTIPNYYYSASFLFQ